MKRVSCACLALLTVFLAFSSCNVATSETAFDPIDKDISQDETYESLIVDSANNEPSVPIEIDYWSKGYFQKENMPNRNCTFLENEYTGVYVNSFVDALNSYTTDIYRTENGIYFGLRSDTGELSQINFMNSAFFDTEPYLPDIEEHDNYAVTLAQNVANKYIDVSQYKQITEEPREQYREKDGKSYKITYHVVDFAREISGVMSSDYMSVKVTSKGKIASVKMGDIGAFDGLNIDFNGEKLEQSITEKVQTKYKEKHTEFNLQKTVIEDQKICVTPDMDVCIYSKVTVEGEYINSKQKQISGVAVITVIEKKK
jgi:hypothetical protein